MDGAAAYFRSGSNLAEAARSSDVAPRPIRTHALAVLLVCAGYYIGGVIALIARFPGSGISTIWLATPIILVAFLLAPPPTWWLYILALLPVHFHLVWYFQGPVPAPVILCQFGGNVAHAILSAVVMRSLLGPVRLRLDDWRGMATFIASAGIAISWGVSALVVYFFRQLGWVSDFWSAWTARSLSSGVGALTVTPLVLWAVTAGNAVLHAAPPRRYWEFALLMGALVAVGVPVFRGTLLGLDSNPVWLYVPLPILLWAAVRFNPAALCLSLLVVALLSLSNSMSGRGPFSTHSPVQNTLALQVFLLANAIPLLLLSAAIGEWRRALAALGSSEQQYRAVVESQSDLICRFLPDTTLTFVNEAYCRCFGRSREQLLGHKFVELIPESARQATLQRVRALEHYPQVQTYEHEVTLPDGTAGWQQWTNYVIFESDRVVREFQAIGHDFTQRKRAEELIRQNQAELRENMARIRDLAARLIGVQETERTRIAMELHDGVSQRLAALSMGLSALKRHLTGEGLEDLARLQSGAASLAHEIRCLSHDLHPVVLRHAGLVPALRAFCKELDGRNGVSVAFAAGEDLPAVSNDVSLCLYRVAQEALHNVVRHAQAKRVSVIVLRENHQLRMTVSDDGRGFDRGAARESDGIGLVTMEERVKLLDGSIDIDSQPSRGTELRVEIPLREARDESA